MSLTNHITAVEIHDGKELLAKVEIQDEQCAMVTIKTVNNATSWAPLAEAVRQALVSMNLEDDK
jgi:hypothetical protein